MSLVVTNLLLLSMEVSLVKPFCTAIVLAAACVAPAFAATSLYVSTSTSETNCSTAAGFKGYFDAQSFSIGGSNATTVSSSGGSGAGKISLQNLTIAKAFDNCSGTLITQFLAEQRIPTVTLVETETIGNGVSKTILTITLTDAIISNYVLTDGAGGSVGAEQLSFGYQTACIVSSPLNGNITKVCYNSVTNVTSSN